MTTFSPAFLRAARSGTVSFFRSSGTELALCGARVKRLDLPPDRVGVRSERRLVEGRLRPRLGIEVPERVDATHEDGGIAHLGLAHVRRDIADRHADAPVVAAVCIRAVHQLDM